MWLPTKRWGIVAEWSNAVLSNGLGRYQTRVAAGAGHRITRRGASPNWGLIELIKLAVRVTFRDAMRRLSQSSGIGTDWAPGSKRSRALLSDGGADRLYREAISGAAHLDGT